MDTYIIMRRDTGAQFVRERTLQPWQAEELVQRLGGVVLFNTRTREVLYREAS